LEAKRAEKNKMEEKLDQFNQEIEQVRSKYGDKIDKFA
jgi:hypothetical protein